MYFSKVVQLAVLFSAQLLIIHGQGTADSEAGKLLTEKSYSKMFQLKRKETKELLNIIKNEAKYELKYKLIKAAYEKLLKILQNTETILKKSTYDPLVDKFPSKDVQLLNAVTITLENTCIFSDILLHNPDISNRILDSYQNKEGGAIPTDWKDLINWCIKYTRYFSDRIVDSKSQELLWLVEQEINPEMRTPQFVNPYREAKEEQAEEKKKKTPKKVDRGPKMVSRDEF